MSEKNITIVEFADELIVRLEDGKTVDCCKKELIRLAEIIKKKLPGETIRVDWNNH